MPKPSDPLTTNSAVPVATPADPTAAVPTLADPTLADPTLADPTLTAEAVIRELALRPHPEGGHYRETWRATPADGVRGAATAILFLLAAGERSHWHRVDATELWLWHAGAALRLAQSADGQSETEQVVGPDLAAGAQSAGRGAGGSLAGGGEPGRVDLGELRGRSRVPVQRLRAGAARLAAAGWRPLASGRPRQKSRPITPPTRQRPAPVPTAAHARLARSGKGGKMVPYERRRRPKNGPRHPKAERKEAQS